MPQQIQLFDGEIIEFEDGTPESVILATAKRETVRKQVPEMEPPPGAAPGTTAGVLGAMGAPPLTPTFPAAPIQAPAPPEATAQRPRPPENPEDDPRWLEKYNTPLAPEEEVQFQAWLKEESQRQKRNIAMDLYTYDVRGFWKAGEKVDETGHGTDRYKKPSHPTFSDQSIWAGAEGEEPGHWDDETGAFYPGKSNLRYYGREGIQREFEREPGRKEHLAPEEPQETAPQRPGLIDRIGAWWQQQRSEHAKNRERQTSLMERRVGEFGPEPALEPYIRAGGELVHMATGGFTEPGGAGGGAEEFQRGVVQGTGMSAQAMGDLVGVLAAQAAAIEADPRKRAETQQEIQRRVGEFAERLNTEGLVQRPAIEDIQQIKDWDDFSKWAWRNLGTQAPIMAMLVAGGLVAPEAAPATIGIALETGIISRDIFEQTGEFDATLPLLFGVPAGLLESMPVTNLLTRNPAVARSFTEWLAKKAGAAVRQGFHEGITEGAQSGLEILARDWARQNQGMLEQIQITSQDGRKAAMWEIFNSIAAGGVVGAPMGLGQSVQIQREATAPDAAVQAKDELAKRAREALEGPGMTDPNYVGPRPPGPPSPLRAAYDEATGGPPPPTEPPPGGAPVTPAPVTPPGAGPAEALLGSVERSAPLERHWDLAKQADQVENKLIQDISFNAATNRITVTYGGEEAPSVIGPQDPRYRAYRTVWNDLSARQIAGTEPPAATPQKTKWTKEEIDEKERELINSRPLADALAISEREDALAWDPTTDFPIEKAQGIADKRNARRKEAMGLYAETEDVGMTTAEEVKAEHDRWTANMDAHAVSSMTQASIFRKRLGATLSQEEFEFLQKKRLSLPDSPSYSLEFWRAEVQARLSEEDFTQLSERAKRSGDAMAAKWSKGEAGDGAPPLAGVDLDPESPLYKAAVENARKVPFVGDDERLVTMFASSGGDTTGVMNELRTMAAEGNTLLTEAMLEEIEDGLKAAWPETTDPQIKIRQAQTALDEYRAAFEGTAEELGSDPEFQRLEGELARAKALVSGTTFKKVKTPLQKMPELHGEAEGIFGAPVDDIVLHPDGDLFVESPERRGKEGWVRKDDPRYEAMKGVYDRYTKAKAGATQGDLGFGGPIPVAELTPEQLQSELDTLQKQGMASSIDEETTRQDRIAELQAELAKRPATTTAAREPWEMTKEEFVAAGKGSDADSVAVRQAAHAQHVKEAVAQGKPVPRPVLEQYRNNGWAAEALAKLDKTGEGGPIPELKVGDTWVRRSDGKAFKIVDVRHKGTSYAAEWQLLPAKGGKGAAIWVKTDTLRADFDSPEDQSSKRAAFIKENVKYLREITDLQDLEAAYDRIVARDYPDGDIPEEVAQAYSETSKKLGGRTPAAKRFIQGEIGKLLKTGAGILRDFGSLEVVYDNGERIKVERRQKKRDIPGQAGYEVILYRANGAFESSRVFHRWPEVHRALQEHWKGVPTGEVNEKRQIQQEILKGGGVIPDDPNLGGPYYKGTDETAAMHPRYWAKQDKHGEWIGGQAMDQWFDHFKNRGMIQSINTMDEFIAAYLDNVEPEDRKPADREPTQEELDELDRFEESDAATAARGVAEAAGINVMSMEELEEAERKRPFDMDTILSGFVLRLANARDMFDVRATLDYTRARLRMKLAEANKSEADLFEPGGVLDDLYTAVLNVRPDDEIPFEPTELPERQPGESSVLFPELTDGFGEDPAIDALFEEPGEEVEAEEEAPEEEEGEEEEEESGKKKGKGKKKKKPPYVVPYIAHGFGMVMEGPAGLFKSSVTRGKIINELVKAAKAVGASGVIRIGRMGRLAKTARGFFEVYGEIIRIGLAGNYATAAHEFAHMIEKAVFGWQKGSPFKKPLFNSRTRIELAALGKALYGDQKPSGGYMREGWAEAWRLWLEAPDELAKIAPVTKAWIDEVFFEAFPESKKFWLSARKLVEEWTKGGAKQRGDNSMRDATTIREKLKHWRDTLKDVSRPESLWEMLHPFQRFTKEVADKLGRELSFAEGPYNLARALNKTQNAIVRYWVEQRQTNAAKQDVGPSLNDIIKPLRGIRRAYKDFSLYLWAKRTVALWTDPRHKPRESGMSIQDATYLIETLEKEHPQFRTVAEEFYKWQQNILLYAAEASPSFRSAVSNIMENDPGCYVPLHRVFDYYDERYQRMGGRTHTGGAGDIVKKLRGSGRDIRPVLDTSIAQAVRIVRAAHEEMVINRVMELAGVEGMAGWVTRLPKDLEPKVATSVARLLEEANKAVWKDSGKDLIITTEDRDGEPMSPDEIRQEYGNLLVKIWGVSDRKPKAGENPVIPRVNPDGKVDWYEINWDLYEALTTFEPFTFYGKGRGGMGALAMLPFKLMEATTRTFRMGTTGLRASFGLITNPERDLQTLLMNSNSGLKWPILLYHYFAGLRASLLYNVTGGLISNVPLKPTKWFKPDAWKDPYIEFAMKWGGQMVQPLAQDISHTARLSRKLFQGRVKRLIDVRNWVDVYRDLVQAPELAPRVAEMRAIASKQGWDIERLTTEQALTLFQAYSEVTTDFRAEGKLGRYGNRVIPFLNASIQGPRANLRAMQRRPITFWFRGIQLLGLTMWAWWRNKDREWWKELSWRERALFWHVPLNDPEDELKQEIVRIPRAFEIGMFFSALPEAIVDGWYRQNPEAVKEWFWTALATANPIDIPVLPKLVYELGANYDIFWKRMIESQAEAMDNMPDYQKFGPYTSGLAVYLGELAYKMHPNAPGAGVSPKKIDHAIKSIFGPVSMDLLLALSKPGVVDREKELSDRFITGVQFKRGGALGTRTKSIDEVYTLFHQAQQKSGDFKRDETEEEKIRRLLLGDATTYISSLGQVQTFTKELRFRRELQRERVRVAQEVLKIIESKDPYAMLEERGMLKSIRKLAETDARAVVEQFRMERAE